MELLELRNQIDLIDQDLVCLFCRRMEIAAKIADYKKEQNLPVYHPEREQEVLRKVAQQVGPEMENDICRLYSLLFELSRSYQCKRNGVS